MAEKETQGHSGRRELLFLAFGLYLALALPRLLTIGLFQDGVVFSSVARNMAEGVGGFWTPRFTDTSYRLEFMHPPLGAFVLSLVFRLFGDLSRLEVAYGVGVGLLNLGLLGWLWRTVSSTPIVRETSSNSHVPKSCGAWFPLLLYVVMPMTAHSYTSNLLENPLTTFVLLATLAGHRATLATSRGSMVGWSLAAGLLVCLAVQTKGPPGAFVLVYPALMGLLLPGVALRRGILVSSMVLATGLAATAALILPSAAALEFTRQHYGGLVVDALKGGKIPSQGRFSVAQTLVEETLVPVVLLLIGSALTRVWPRFRSCRRAHLFLAAGLAGSLPFLITTHQYSRYAFPALPMIVIALAFSWQDLGARLEAGTTGKVRAGILGLGAFFVLFGVSGMMIKAGDITKHERFHADFSQPPLELEGRPLFSVCPEGLATDWELVGDVQRHLRASLTIEPGKPYWLTETNSECEVPAACTAVHVKESYELYRCNF